MLSPWFCPWFDPHPFLNLLLLLMVGCIIDCSTLVRTPNATASKFRCRTSQGFLRSRQRTSFANKWKDANDFTIVTLQVATFR